MLESDDELAKLSLLDRLHILEHIATALGHLHSKGVVHKNVKPSNILLKWQLDEPGS